MPSEIVARQTCNCRTTKASSRADRNDVSTTRSQRVAGARAPASVATGRTLMRHLFPKICVSAAAMLAAGAASANDELIKMSQDPKDWVMPTGNYANHRYSQLDQITAENA